MTHAKKLYLIAAGAIVVFLPGTASAQLGMPGVSLHDDSRGLDPEEQTKRKAVDDAYKATMEKIPDQKNQTTLVAEYGRTMITMCVIRPAMSSSAS
jgi:hypothetical protein